MKLNELLTTITPLDWHCEGSPTDCTFDIVGQNKDWVATVHNGIEADESNACYVTHAANVLPELVDALRAMLSLRGNANAVTTRLTFEQAEQALAKAEEVEP